MTYAARRLDQAFFAGTVAIVVLAVTASVAASLDPAAGRFALAALGGLCHQMAERSFHLLGHPMGLCARCTGVYAGMAVAWVWGAGRAFKQGDLLLSVALMSVMALEWGVGHQIPVISVNATRFFSGLAFGLGWIVGPHRWCLALVIHGRSLLRRSAWGRPRRAVRHVLGTVHDRPSS